MNWESHPFGMGAVNRITTRMAGPWSASTRVASSRASAGSGGRPRPGQESGHRLLLGELAHPGERGPEDADHDR